MKNSLLKKKIGVVLTVGMVWTSQAFAEEVPTSQLDQITVTADRIYETVGSTPANVTVITGNELQNKGARNLADALTGVSGVVVKNYGNTGQKAIPYIFGSDRVVVLIDGKRMNLPQGIGTGNGGVDLNAFMLGDNVEHIEIVRGGASTLYGADAVGGVINIITKKGSDSTKTTTSIAAGNYGTRVYTFTTGGQDKNTHWQLSGLQNSTDGQRPNSAYKGKNVSFRLDQDLNKAENLTFTYDYFGSHAGMPGSLAYPSASDSQDVLRHNWSASYAKEHSDGSLNLRYYSNDQVYSGINYGNFRHENSVKAFEYQDSTRLDIANLLTWGGEWRKDEVTSTAAGNVARNGITKALYFQNQHSFTDSAKFTFGLRHDDHSIYGTHWLPQASYLYQANDQTSYYANWAKVFKAPKFDDLYGDDGYGDTGNPNLKPETGWTAEVGVKRKLNSTNEAMISVFQWNLHDAIRWTQAADYTYHPHNLDQFKATGVNANLISKLSPVTTSDIGYTYLDSRDQNDQSVGDPRHTFHVGFNMQEGKLTQSLYGIYQAKTGTGSNQVTSHFIVNTNTQYAINQNTALFLTVNNLFDKQYQAVNGYPADRRTVLLGLKQTF